MRFIPGMPITEFADRNQLTINQRLALVMRTCDAVSYAHRYLIVHRDLKPSNILVTSEGHPVVIDFGISTELHEKPEAESLRLTTTEQRPMTPAYASPEQVRGEAVSTSTDQYALGLILYELISGHHAYSDAGQRRRNETVRPNLYKFGTQAKPGRAS